MNSSIDVTQKIDILSHMLNNYPLVSNNDEDEMTTQAERLTALETDKKMFWFILTAAVAAFVTWNGYLTVTLISATKDIQAIKQERRDAGAEIVSQISNPENDEQLKSGMIRVTAGILSARASKIHPDQHKVVELGETIAKSVSKNPKVPESWQAASELIAYRSGDLTAERPDCFSNEKYWHIATGFTQEQILDHPSGSYVIQVTASNCTLNLNDHYGYLRSSIGKRLEVIRKEADRHVFSKGMYVPINLVNVLVTYSGGESVPISFMSLEDCQFRITVYATPPPQVQNLTEMLLIAKDFSHVKVSEPS